MTPIQKLTEAYRKFKNAHDIPTQRLRSNDYKAMVEFALHCDLVKYNEIEIMEYENNS